MSFCLGGDSWSDSGQCLGLAAGAVLHYPGVPVSVSLVLAGGTLVDVNDWGRSARDIHDAIVVVRDGRITDVGSRGAISVPKGARVIDCAGKFLIPGLVDGLAGMNSQGQANANLYMGVTTVVARGDYRRGSIDFAAHPSPHLYFMDSIGSTDNWSLLANRPEWKLKLREGAHPVELSPEDTARQLSDTARLGTRVLLLGHDLTAASTQWIIARAHQMGLITYGEFISTPYRVGVEAGVDALPDLTAMIWASCPMNCSSRLWTTPKDRPPTRLTTMRSGSRRQTRICAPTPTFWLCTMPL